MAWSKFSPHEPPAPPTQAASPEAARRSWFLKWGWWISNAMVVLGFVLMIYWWSKR